jgi:hypothetical protein
MTLDSEGPTRDKNLRAIPVSLWEGMGRLAKRRRITIRVLFCQLMERELEAQAKKDARAQR